MEKIELKVNIRNTIGDGPAKQLRRDGMMPAILYGAKTEPVKLSVTTRDFENILKTSNVGQVLLTLLIQDGMETSKTVMIKELQIQPVSREFLHVDFYEVAMDQKIKVNIPVVTVGVASGVELGGVLQLVRHEVEVYCFPNNIPGSLEVDVTDMGIGDSKHIEQVTLSDNIELVDESNFTVVTVLSPKTEEEEETEVGDEDVDEADAVTGEAEDASAE